MNHTPGRASACAVELIPAYGGHAPDAEVDARDFELLMARQDLYVEAVLHCTYRGIAAVPMLMYLPNHSDWPLSGVPLPLFVIAPPVGHHVEFVDPNKPWVCTRANLRLVRDEDASRQGNP